MQTHDGWWIFRQDGCRRHVLGSMDPLDIALSHLSGDLLTFFAYVTIPVAILWVMRNVSRRISGPLPREVRVLLVLVSGFILTCGLSHVWDVLTVWWPMYRLQGFWKILLTAPFSLAASYKLFQNRYVLIDLSSLLYRSWKDEQRTRDMSLEETSQGSPWSQIENVLERQREDALILDTIMESDIKGVGLMVLSSNGEIVRLSKSWSNQLSCNREELEGRAFTDFVHPDDLEVAKKNFKDPDEYLERTLNGFKEHSNDKVINRYRRGDGSYVSCEWFFGGELEGNRFGVCKFLEAR